MKRVVSDKGTVIEGDIKAVDSAIVSHWMRGIPPKIFDRSDGQYHDIVDVKVYDADNDNNRNR